MSGESLMHDCMMHPTPHEALGMHGHLECIKVCLMFAKSCQETRQTFLSFSRMLRTERMAYMRFENSPQDSCGALGGALGVGESGNQEAMPNQPGLKQCHHAGRLRGSAGCVALVGRLSARHHGALSAILGCTGLYFIDGMKRLWQSLLKTTTRTPPN